MAVWRFSCTGHFARRNVTKVLGTLERELDENHPSSIFVAKQGGAEVPSPSAETGSLVPQVRLNSFFSAKKHCAIIQESCRIPEPPGRQIDEAERC
jgi:hypothetical protein